MTIFYLRLNLYRDTAPVPFSNFIYREKDPAGYQTCTATGPVCNKNCTMTAKSTPYLPCTVTIFCLRSNLNRDTAPVPFSNFSYRDYFPAVYQTCTATAPTRNIICTMTAKSTPYLACHRDNFPAKAPGLVAG